MSDNPFDVFAADFRAAIPSTNEPAKQQQQQQEPSINIMAEPAAAPVPVMNSAPAPPPMNSAPMAPPNGMMGAPPPPVQHQQQHQPHQQPQQPGGYGAPAPPPVYGNGMNGTMGGPPAFGNPPPPPANAYGMGASMGATMGASMTAPPPPPPNAWNSTSGGMSMAGSMNAGSMNGAMVPSATPSNPYATMMNNAPPPAAPPAPTGTADPFGMQPAYGAPPTQPPAYGVPPPAYGVPPPAYGAPPPVPDASSVAPSVTPSTDPWGTAAPTPMPPAPAAPPVPAAIPETPSVTEPSVMTSDPWGSTTGTAPPLPPQQQPPPPAPPVPAAPGAIVPTNATSADPFDIFAAGQAPVGVGVGVPPPQPVPIDDRSVMTPGAPPAYNQEQVLQAADDPWSQMGFGEAPTPGGGATTGTGTGTTSGPPVPSSDSVPAIASGEPNLLGGDDGLSPSPTNVHDGKVNDGQLPPGGEWYDARIYTPTLGVMFFKPQELTDSLFLQTDRSLVDTLGDRPVVAFIVEGSSARAAGVELGHVLLKVNDIDVKNPKEASRLIKEGPRPLPLLFYVPDTTVVVAEGEHMVKYDTRETGAPNSAKDWKPKYVVIGGIIAQPWMMNMYRSKSEYDIAVIETQARRPVSVKVKQFSLQGARIQNDWQGPQMVKYKNKLHPWKYIVILPVSRNPIKISSPNLSQLKPVHEGVRRVLMAQQRHQPTSAPVQRADPYGQPPDDNGGAVGGGGGPGEYGHHQGPPGGAPPGGMGGQPAYGGNPGGNMYETQGGVSSARRSSQY